MPNNHVVGFHSSCHGRNKLMSDLPSSQQFLMQTIFFVCLGIFVYLMTRWLKFQHEAWPYSNPRQSAWVAVGTVIAPWSLLIIIGLFSASESAETGTGMGIKNTPTAFLLQLIVYLIAFSPALIAMKIRHESW